MAKRKPTNYYQVILSFRGKIRIVILVYKDKLKEHEELIKIVKGNRHLIFAKAEDIRLSRQIEAPLKIR